VEVRGNFTWSLTELTLRNIHLKVGKGEFVCVIGDVGAGKTSLLSAINGDLVYVPDSEVSEPVETLRKILFDKDFKVESAPIKLSGSVAYVE